MQQAYRSFGRGAVRVLMVLILSAGGAFSESPPPTDVRSEITALLEEYFVHRNNADFKYFERFYTPDVVTVYSGRLADGRQALIKTVHGFIEGETERSTEIEDLVVTPRKNIVWVRYTMHNTSFRGKTRQDSRLFTTMGFEKTTAGRWRCFHVSAAPAASASRNRPPSDGPSLSVRTIPVPPGGAPAAPEASELHQKMKSLLKEYFVPRNRADLDYFHQFYTRDVITVHSGKLADGRDDLIQTLHGFIDGRTDRKTEIEDLVISPYKDTVWVRYIMHNTWVRNGKREEFRLFTTMGFEQTAPGQFKSFTVAAAPQRTGAQRASE